MMHANKMILVPHDIGGRKDDGTANLMSNLDKEMNRILQDNALASDTKIILYSNILHRYRKAMEEQQKPFQLEIQEPLPPTPAAAPVTITATNGPASQAPASQATEPTPIKEKSDLEARLMVVIPQRWQRNAKELLYYATHNPHIQWSDKGEMFVDNKKIAESNIIDLISDFSRESKTRQPAVGADLFLKSLLKENIPREIIINKARFGLNEKEIVATPNTKTPSLNIEQSHSSSSSSSSSAPSSANNSTPRKKASTASVLQSTWQMLSKKI